MNIETPKIIVTEPHTVQGFKEKLENFKQESSFNVVGKIQGLLEVVGDSSSSKSVGTSNGNTFS